MNAFRCGQPAEFAHSSLKAAVGAMESAKQNAVLWFGEILERRLYREFGYSSMNQYAEQELGFSRTRTGDFLQLCRKLDRLPRVKKKLETGEMGYTTARVLVQVADQENEEAWVQEAATKSRRELEQQVKRAKRQAAQVEGQLSLVPEAAPAPAAAVPVRVSFEMSPLQLARYEALWEQIRKQGSAPADKVEALLEMMACYVAESAPRGGIERAPFQVNVLKNEETGQATVQTSRGELVLSEAELERVECDCQTHQPGRRNTSAVPPSIRRKVLARDRYRCQRPGCGNTRFLEEHHIIPRARGGGNDPDNLITLCSACHGLVHEGRWDINNLAWLNA
jgi:hypothetical protein